MKKFVFKNASNTYISELPEYKLPSIKYIAEDVLCEFEADEAEILKPLVKKRLAGDYSRKNTEKVMRHFVARGYSFSDVRAAIGNFEENDFEL